MIDTPGGPERQFGPYMNEPPFTGRNVVLALHVAPERSTTTASAVMIHEFPSDVKSRDVVTGEL